MKLYTDIDFVYNKCKPQTADTEFLSIKETEPVRHLHFSIPEYKQTPLVALDSLGKKLGVKGIYIKDESYRFGLNAFKGLGGIYALSRIACEKAGLDINKTNFSDLLKPHIKEKLSEFVFVTATDGNHGKGIAWAANKLGCKSHVYMPKGSSENRAQAIRDCGQSEVVITNMNYDDTVRYALHMSKKNNWALVQDTSWEGYEKIPKWIVQGYTTMAFEAIEQLGSCGIDAPTHVFLQAGVGAMAGSVTGCLINHYKQARPLITIAEPVEVACIFRSMEMADGLTHTAAGNGETIMAGLNCGEACTITWPLIRDFAHNCVACPDYVAKIGMRLLAAPYGADRKVISGESGAVTCGLLSLLMEREELSAHRKRMGLDENSIILLFNTEGDTDIESYQAIVK